jgi:hypothetical protein
MEGGTIHLALGDDADDLIDISGCLGVMLASTVSEGKLHAGAIYIDGYLYYGQGVLAEGGLDVESDVELITDGFDGVRLGGTGDNSIGGDLNVWSWDWGGWLILPGTTTVAGSIYFDADSVEADGRMTVDNLSIAGGGLVEEGTVEIGGTLTLGGSNTTYDIGTVNTWLVLQFLGGSVQIAPTVSVNCTTDASFIGCNVQNSGTFRIVKGWKADVLQIEGSYHQSAQARLELIAGPLNITGAATFDGTLNVGSATGISTPGETFEIITYGSHSGEFAMIEGLDLGGGLVLYPEYTPTALVLTVVEIRAIGGHVLDSDNNPLEGVEIMGGSGGGSYTTGPIGYYELQVPQGWTGAVTPVKAGWSFEPASRSYMNVTDNQVDQDFLGRRLFSVGGAADRDHGGPHAGDRADAEFNGDRGDADHADFDADAAADHADLDGDGYPDFDGDDDGDHADFGTRRRGSHDSADRAFEE